MRGSWLWPAALALALAGCGGDELNKRNGISQDLNLKPGQAVRVGDVVVRLQTCERTPPWEPEPLTGAFVQVDVRNVQNQFQRVFSGWLFRESPSLNVVEHPVYDVWTKSCEMTHPAGPGEPAETPDAANANSSAPKSGNSAAPASPASRPKAWPRRDNSAAAASNSAASNSR
jgi:pyruvate/2-oxoglutarate dehydrogenase complex dihydrolipoamide acyltransferase (E2) component